MPVQVIRLYEQIVEQIEQQILTGQLQPGQQLPSERELAEQFGASRTSVREAIRTLREKGLVEVHPGRGTFVVNNHSQGIRQSLGWVLRANPAKGFADLIEVREILEPEIAALAAERAAETHVEALREAIARMDAAMDDAEAFIEADSDFHITLAEAAGNELLSLMLDTIVDLLHELRMRIFHVPGGPERGQYYHKRLLAAIEARDPEQARELMRAHMKQVREDSQAFATPRVFEGRRLTLKPSHQERRT